jgi:hypothetical protein
MPLVEVEPLSGDVAFFKCPKCQRDFTLKPGKALTFRWPHPISLPIYAIQFDDSLSGRATDVVTQLIHQQSRSWLELFVQEIRLELAEPTQLVGDIIDCRLTESDLRDFLRQVMEQIERHLPSV